MAGETGFKAIPIGIDDFKDSSGLRVDEGLERDGATRRVLVKKECGFT